MLFKRLSISLVILSTLFFSIISVSAKDVYLGGDSIGINLSYNGILITGTYQISIDNNQYNPKYDGYNKGQIITHVNGQRVYYIKELMRAIEENISRSKRIELTLNDNSEILNKELKLQNIDNQFSTGLYVSEGITGIGTLTYYNPSTQRFGALGHIMSDIDLSTEIKSVKGHIFDAKVTHIIKSQPYTPGEKIADISELKIGDITSNNHYGLYGNYTDINLNYRTKIETADISEVKKGKAYFYTVIDGNKIEKFNIEITQLKNQKKCDFKGITFKIVDKKIIENCNGIIQGMSGSPIVQNGKLIGCITHVDTKNPQIGYGLYIEWMLENDY